MTKKQKLRTIEKLLRKLWIQKEEGGAYHLCVVPTDRGYWKGTPTLKETAKKIYIVIEDV